MLDQLAEQGWVSADREEIEPPICRWTVGELSLVLSPDGGSGEGIPIGTTTEGATTVTEYVVDGDYYVLTDVDFHDPSGPYRLKVERRGENE